MKRSLVSAMSLAALCLTPLALTGCGGGDDDIFFIGDQNVFAYASVAGSGINVYAGNSDVGQFTQAQQVIPGTFATLQKIQDDDRLLALRSDGGNVLVTYQVADDGFLSQIDADFCLPVTLGQEIVFNSSNRVYHASGSQIEKFDIDGNGTPGNQVITNTSATELLGGASTSNGAFVYFGDTATGAIWGFAVDGGNGGLVNVEGADIPTFLTPGTSVTSMGFDSRGFLLVVDDSSDAIHSFLPNANGTLNLVSTANLPAGAAYFDVESRDGVVYVSQVDGNKQTQVLTLSDTGVLTLVNAVNGGGAFLRLVDDFDVLTVGDLAGFLRAQLIDDNGNLTAPSGDLGVGGVIQGLEVITTNTDDLI